MFTDHRGTFLKMYFLHHRPNSWVLLSLLRVHPLNMCQRRPAVSSEDCAALIGPFFIWRHFLFFIFFRKCSVGVVCIMSNIHFTVILACCSPPIERGSTNRWRPLKSTKTHAVSRVSCQRYSSCYSCSAFLSSSLVFQPGSLFILANDRPQYLPLWQQNMKQH